MKTYSHQIGESPTVIRTGAAEEYYVRIRKVSDGEIFDPITEKFSNTADPETSWFPMATLGGDQGVYTLKVDFLPNGVLDLLFDYKYVNFFSIETHDGYERHQFGTPHVSLDTCTVYGTLTDVTGVPVAGQRVEAVLKRSGFFVDKAGLVGFSSGTLTDSSGYFELPLVQGTDVTISIPTIGFVTTGKVPYTNSTELSYTCLMRS